MSIGLGVTKTYSGAGATLDATGDKLVIPIVKPANAYRFGFIVNGATASGTAVVVALDHRPTAGSDTGRVELASFSPTATVAQGEGVYFDLTVRAEVNPGEELVVEVSTAGAVGATGHVFVEVVEYPFQRTSGSAADDRLGNMTEES